MISRYSIVQSHHPNFTISYLIDSCGLSPDTATLTFQKLHLQRPDSVLTLLREHGFIDTQISNLIRKRPLLLLANLDILLPKFQFFLSIGISNTNLARTLTADPTLLTRSLEKQIIPSYNFLKSVLISDEKVAASLKHTSWVFLEDHKKNLVPNLNLLKEMDVPESCVTLLLTHFPEALMQKKENFAKLSKEIKEMGFNPKKTTFVLAIHVFSGEGNKSIYNRCYEVYKRWGWSDDDILMAFKKHPHCMILSEDKIMKTMDYLVNKMGWLSGMIVRCPVVLFFSLEKRIKLRCSVAKVNRVWEVEGKVVRGGMRGCGGGGRNEGEREKQEQRRETKRHISESVNVPTTKRPTVQDSSLQEEAVTSSSVAPNRQQGRRGCGAQQATGMKRLEKLKTEEVRTAATSRDDASGVHLSLHPMKPLQLLPPLQPEAIRVRHACEDLLIPLPIIVQLLSLLVKAVDELLHLQPQINGFLRVDGSIGGRGGRCPQRAGAKAASKERP
ncbi:hypothetical protein Ahy_B06g084215 [Arachis hypogaea]|uniref:Uncharacterized protein n=1 Tax=Arachis hypogaea TaxID=3818 RepID=A0A444YRD5_ARAHY|nr:hypothetical protein Ahy_B06g084215 [Arachis hypogaea]